MSGKSSPRRPIYLTESILMVSVTGLFIFLWLTYHVTGDQPMDFDRRLLLLFRHTDDVSNPIGPDWFNVVVRDISALGGLLVVSVVTFSVCGYFYLRGQTAMAVFVFCAIAGGSLFNSMLKLLIDRPRPDLVPHGTSAAMSSFPSGHAMMAAVAFLTLGAILAAATERPILRRYILAWSIILTVGVGFSRVYLGVHWPTDVLAGWLMGALWAMACLFTGHKIGVFQAADAD